METSSRICLRVVFLAAFRAASRSLEMRLGGLYPNAKPALAKKAKIDFPLAQALHGLVAADALGVPNEWLRLNTSNEDRAGMPEFKYRDYCRVYGLEDKQYLTLSSPYTAADEDLQTMLTAGAA